MACLVRIKKDGKVNETIVHDDNQLTNNDFTLETNRRRTKIQFKTEISSAELVNHGVIEDYSHLTRFTLNSGVKIGMFKTGNGNYEIWHLSADTADTLTMYINSSNLLRLTNPKR
jgi:bifunctional N-acetylglucosamine-1-phosphate-uridyltransferase/glucosamine-1-phosphate-acetyltransferase GlmU-like protein